MDISVIFVVLGAAFLHAFWNFQVRGTEDKALGMAAVMFGHLPLAIIGLTYVGLPVGGSWPYVMVSAVLHLGYQVFLLNAYRFGELTQIYPVARSVSPMLITLFTMIMVPGILQTMEVIGVIMISGSIMIYGIAQYRTRSVGFTGIILAVITGFFIASYSIVDAEGTRIAQSAISYYGASTTANAVLFAIYLLWFKPSIFGRIFSDALSTFVIGGNASYFAYVAVLWACLSTPVAVVSSLRETSVLFAVGLGVLVLKEKMTFLKVGVILTIFCGVIVLRLA
jgi:drug/metabolite transporter (DMT)-like permease